MHPPPSLQVVVSQEELVSLLPPASHSLAHVVLPTAGPFSAAEAPGSGGGGVGGDSSSPGLLGRLEDLVYVIYTSGSTGRRRLPVSNRQ